VASDSTGVVIAALIANGAIAVLKFGGYLLTGSPSMLSEAYHSVSDTGNQVFLLIGIRYGAREANRTHPFGYGKAQFFYAFLVSVLLFGIAGWESAKHGYSALFHHSGEHVAREISRFGYTFPRVWVNYAVLLAAIGFETWALKKANDSIRAQMRTYGWGDLREAFSKTSNVVVLTALTEDAIALAGAAIALVGVFLTDVTGNPVFDAAAALLIGLLLMGFAIALAWQNKRLLLGESLPKADEDELRAVAAENGSVAEVMEFRTVFFGAERALVTAVVRFDAEMDTETIDDAIADIESRLMAADERVKKVYVEPEFEG
jgi:cation diffusion facilitator family transporter